MTTKSTAVSSTCPGHEQHDFYCNGPCGSSTHNDNKLYVLYEWHCSQCECSFVEEIEKEELK